MQIKLSTVTLTSPSLASFRTAGCDNYASKTSGCKIVERGNVASRTIGIGLLETLPPAAGVHGENTALSSRQTTLHELGRRGVAWLVVIN